MIKRIFIYFGFLCLFFSAGQQLLAQSVINGTITDVNGIPIKDASVLLLKSSDSSLVKGMVSDIGGKYSFENIGKGRYLVSASFTGMQQVFTKVFNVTSNRNDKEDLGTISLNKEEVELKAIQVAVKKPMFEQKIDRLVVNVANSITSAGNTALEVLERSPGIIVDHRNNTLSMNGKDGVVIMINGKISHMPMSSIVQMLAGMNAGNIEKIELISTPPANFDAAGNAGYINIVLKESDKVGTNGSYSATIGVEKYPILNGSINVNHRKGKINIFGDVSFSRTKTPFGLDFYNKLSNSGTITENTNSTDRTDTTINISGRFGIDYQPAKRTIIGFLLTGNENNFSQSESKRGYLSINNSLDTISRYSNKEQNDWKNYNININAQHTFRENEQLTFNGDYIHFHNPQPVNYFESNYDRGGKFIYDQSTRSAKTTLFTFWVGALDYATKIGSKIKIETGIKETVGGFSNDISFEKYTQNIWTNDPAYSANYTMSENYSAAYISFDINLNKKTDAKLGARYEYANTNLETEVTRNIVDRHYGNLFPTLFIAHTIDENNKINFSYNIRIDRPAFTDLAPFTYFADSKNLVTGNPALLASTTNTLKGDYVFKNYMFSMSYSKEDKAIAGFQPEPDSISGKTVFSPQNLINKKVVAAILSVPVSVNDWWNMQYNISGFWLQSNLFYQKKRLRLHQLNYSINVTQRFKLGKEFSMELSGFYQSPQIDGILIRKAIGSLDFGIGKKLKENKGNLTFSANNILNTLSYNGSVDLPAQNLVQSYSVFFSHPSYKITYTHNFGNRKLKGNRTRETGAEEELKRLNN